MQKKPLRIILCSVGIILLLIVPVIWYISNLNDETTIKLDVRKVNNKDYPLNYYLYDYRLYGDKVLRYLKDYGMNKYFYLGWYNLSTNEYDMIAEGSGWVWEYCMDSNYVVWYNSTMDTLADNTTYKQTIYFYDFSMDETNILFEYNLSKKGGIGNIQLIDGYLYFAKHENQSIVFCKYDIPNKQIMDSIEIEYNGYLRNLEIFDSGVVWSDLNETSIYYLDFISKKEELIAEEENPIDSLKIYGNQIVWDTYKGNNSIIKIYDLNTKDEKVIVRPNNGILRGSLQIYDRYIVWIDIPNSKTIYDDLLIIGYYNMTIERDNIFLYDIKTNKIYQLTDDSKLQTNLIIYKNHILYVERHRYKESPKSIQLFGDVMYGTIKEDTKSNLLLPFF